MPPPELAPAFPQSAPPPSTVTTCINKTMSSGGWHPLSYSLCPQDPVRSQSLPILTKLPTHCPLVSLLPSPTTISYMDPVATSCLLDPILPCTTANGTPRMQNLPCLLLPSESYKPESSPCSPRPFVVRNLPSVLYGHPPNTIFLPSSSKCLRPFLTPVLPSPTTPEYPGLSLPTSSLCVCTHVCVQ